MYCTIICEINLIANFNQIIWRIRILFTFCQKQFIIFLSLKKRQFSPLCLGFQIFVLFCISVNLWNRDKIFIWRQYFEFLDDEFLESCLSKLNCKQTKKKLELKMQKFRKFRNLETSGRFEPRTTEVSTQTLHDLWSRHVRVQN